jgi:26S proteasome regulatory subunit N8
VYFTLGVSLLFVSTNGVTHTLSISQDATEPPSFQFQHITSTIGALEAEEVGVEHLLRDVKDTSISTLATQVHAKLSSLKSLISHLHDMQRYLANVVAGKLPLNHQILSQIQDIFNLMPNINVEEFTKSFAVKTNDMMLTIYLSSLIRAVIALHSLINNKVENRDVEKSIEAAKA